MIARDGSHLDPPAVIWATIAIALALIPHALRMSPLLLVSFGALAGWRVLGAYGRVPLPFLPNRGLWLLKQVLSVAAFAGVLVSYEGQLGRDAGVALLSVLLGLKAAEMRTERDFYVVMVLAYFLVVTNFFYSQTILTGCVMLLMVTFTTAGLVHYNTGRRGGLELGTFTRGAKLVTLSVPLMVVLFILFPRIPGPLWGLPQTTENAVSGLSDEMSPGRFRQLVLSDEVAFRVDFETTAPPAPTLYWRGPVMWHTDGKRWFAGKLGNGGARPVTVEGARYRYSVIIEPHGERWLFGLDAVTNTGDRALATSDYRLLARNPVNRRLRYALESTTEYQLPGITADERAAALALPAGYHRRTRALATSWRESTGDARALVDLALRRFREQSYNYSLTPPTPSGDPVDGFLFGTREGYCEHYSSAFVVLMRAAGVPARVVTGYQGGEYNSVSDYMLVRQRDAHAWAEVYFDDSGWVRVDPTAAVAPERVSLGIGELLPARSTLGLPDSPAVRAAWERLFDTWDALQHGWNQWVLGYSTERQRNLLDRLGLERWGHGELSIALTVAVALVIAALYAVMARPGPRAPEEVRLYRRFCARLARTGLVCAPHEGPRDFAHRVALLRRDLAGPAQRIAELYLAVRYADAAAALPALRREVRAFKVR